MTGPQKRRLVKRGLVLLAIGLAAWRGSVAVFGARELHPVPAAIAGFVCRVQAYSARPGEEPPGFGAEGERIECPKSHGERPVIGR